MKKEIHIGELIRKTLKEQGRSPSWLAEKLPCSRGNLYKIFKKSSINTELLQKIEDELNIGFFLSRCESSK